MSTLLKSRNWTYNVIIMCMPHTLLYMILREDGWWELPGKMYELIDLNCIVGDRWSLSHQVFNNDIENAKNLRGIMV